MSWFIQNINIEYSLILLSSFDAFIHIDSVKFYENYRRASSDNSEQ